MAKTQIEEIVRAITGKTYWYYDSKAEALLERIARLSTLDIDDPLVLFLLVHQVQHAGDSEELENITDTLLKLVRELREKLDSMYDYWRFGSESHGINQALVEAHLRAHGIAWGIILLGCAAVVSMSSVLVLYIIVRLGFLKL